MKAAFFIFVGNFFQKIAWLIVMPIIIGSASLEEYGRFELLVTSFSLLSVVVLFGYDSYLARAWYENKSPKLIFLKGLQLVFIIWLLFVLFVVLLWSLISLDIVLIVAGSGVVAVYLLCNMYLRMSQKTMLYAFCLCLPGACLLLGVFLEIALSAVSFILYLLLGYLLGIGLAFYSILNDRDNLDDFGSYSFKKVVFDFCLPLLPSLLLGAFLLQIERFVIEFLLGPESLGAYSASFRLASICGFFVVLFRQIWLPKSMKLVSANDFSWFNSLVVYYLVVGIFICVSFGLLSSYAFEYINLMSIKGSEFLIMLLSTALVIYGSSSITGLFNLNDKRTNRISLAALAGFLTSAISSYTLVSLYGISGAGYGTAIGAFVYSSFLLILGHRLSEFYYYSKISLFFIGIPLSIVGSLYVS